MNLTHTLATTNRVLRQLRHDPRTIALLLLIPAVMITLLRYVFDASPQTFDSIGASLLGVFPLITMFLVTSIATLRERTSGTLERLLSLPIGKADIIAGYALAFGLLAIVQSALATALSVWLLDLNVTGSPWLLLLVALLDALLGTALGLFVSAFAASEFQAVQFMPSGDLPPAAALRPVHPTRPDAARPGGPLQRAADVVRGGRDEPGAAPRRHDDRLRTRRRDRRRLRAPGPDPGRGNAAPPHDVSGIRDGATVRSPRLREGAGRGTDPPPGATRPYPPRTTRRTPTHAPTTPMRG